MDKYEQVQVKQLLAEHIPGGHIVIPDGTKAIGSMSFSKCENIEEITIPDSVVLIGWGAFEDTKWYNNQPDGMVYAGKVAYGWKGSMPENTRIAIREGTKGIAGGAFSEQTNLTGIWMPDGVEAIGNVAFLGCKNLAEINIPSSVEFVSPSAFEDTAWYNNQPDGMIYVGKVAYEYKGTMPKKHRETIRSGTVSITAGAFGNANRNHRLAAVIIPESVTDIGEGMFDDFFCDFSKNVTIYCAEGSAAHKYAVDNKIKYKFSDEVLPF